MAAALDEDTAQTLASGRDSLGAILGTVQTELQKVFMLFVVVFLGTFFALRMAIWDWLKAITYANMDPDVADRSEIIVTTPFEVILLQAKIGILLGILACLPAIVYLSRRELMDRGRWPEFDMSRSRMVGVGVLSLGLFIGGLVYAYWLFFPIMFDFLATQAINVGVEPTYGIVDWTEFLILLTLSFGLAAQLPLVMTGLSYAGIVEYETFRDKWKWAILGIFAFGALFSPPDPFTQVMWAAPLILLYGVSLALSKVATNMRRAGQADIPTGPADDPRIMGAVVVLVGLVGTALGIAAVEFGILEMLYHDIRPNLPGIIRPEEPLGLHAWVGEHGLFGLLAVGVGVGFGAIGLLAIVYLIDVLRRPVRAPIGGMGPHDIEVERMTVEQIERLPDEVFEAMDEDTALNHARDAISEDKPDLAETLFERFDAVHSDEDADAADATTVDESDDEAGVIEETTTGVLGAFSEERDSEEIGGYIDDFRFIADSLKSRLLHMFAVFTIVLAVLFTFLYQGGLGVIRQDFIDRMPDAVQPEDVAVIALHPVEVLIFIVKVSTLAGILAVVPLLLYYAWPAMAQLGWVAGKRNVVIQWSVGALVALLAGSLLGYFIIAPAIFSYLVYDAIQAGMIISYRINSFAWLIIFTTVGIGLLALIPFTMWMLYRGGVASYAGMRDRWREVTIAAFAFAGMFTPAGVLTMFLVGIPVMIFYWVGLAGLWIVTLGGRRGRRPSPEPA